MRAVAHSVAALTAVLAAPVAVAALTVRPHWREGSLERLGRVRGDAGAIWLHGASVGEALAAIPMLDLLRASGRDVVVSTQTLTGRDVVRRARPGLRCQLAPLDHPWSVARSLARSRPTALVLLEAELWPCWIAAAERRGVPVALLSARISDRSFERYSRVRPFIRPTLRRLGAIGARTGRDAERFLALGARPDSVVVTGDLKFDGRVQVERPAADLVRLLGTAPAIVAGSTHPGEEALLLSALGEIEASGAEASLVLAPRDIARADAIVRLAEAHGRRAVRRSTAGEDRIRRGEVLVLDTVGELKAVYGLAAATFVGGTLVPVGGHNLLEPAASGRPVLYGPHVGNAPHAAELLEDAGAGRRVVDLRDLVRALIELLADPAAAAARGGRGREALERCGGSSARCVALLEGLLADRDARGRA